MGPETAMDVAGGLVIALAVVALCWGGFYRLLTSGGDRGGDSGLRQLGCVLIGAGVMILIVGIGLVAWQG